MQTLEKGVAGYQQSCSEVCTDRSWNSIDTASPYPTQKYYQTHLHTNEWHHQCAGTNNKKYEGSAAMAVTCNTAMHSCT